MSGLSRIVLALLPITSIVSTQNAPARLDAASFIRGDVDDDGSLTVRDPMLLLAHLFLERSEGCRDALDVDDDGVLSISDAIVELTHVLLGEFTPPSPFPDCGEDPTDDSLDCEIKCGCPILFPDSPRATRLEHETGVLRAGDMCVLRGINFSPQLEENVVTFRSGSARILGTPVALYFSPSDCDQQRSELRFLVPIGVASGSVELRVGGIFAGAFGFIAGPVITAFDIGEKGDQLALRSSPTVVFDPFGLGTIRIHGLNLEEVDRIDVKDSSGTQNRLLPQEFRQDTPEPANGLDTLIVPLDDVRVGIVPPRDDIAVTVLAAGVRYNTIYVPVVTFLPGEGMEGNLGPIVSGVTLPTGVRTGPVRLRLFHLRSPGRHLLIGRRRVER